MGIATKLKELRNEAQPKVSVRKMADLLGVPASTYAAYEDPKKFKKAALPLQLTLKIAHILANRGVQTTAVLELAGLTDEIIDRPRHPSLSPDEDWLTVNGTVEAGAWRVQTEWPESERYDVRFGPSPYPKGERFAVRMEGLSMNRTILPGSDLECLRVKFSPVPPRPGDLVIVERKAHDLVELTVKRLAMDGQDFVLLCESNEPEFQEPIRIGRPDASEVTDDEIAVVGIVLSAKLDLAPKDLSERRYRRA